MHWCMNLNWPVMSRLCWCGPAVCGGRSPSRGPTLWPWSRRHRWPPFYRRTGRSAPPPHGPWARVNTDRSRYPRRAVWRPESHWPPWESHTNMTLSCVMKLIHIDHVSSFDGDCHCFIQVPIFEQSLWPKLGFLPISKSMQWTIIH